MRKILKFILTLLLIVVILIVSFKVAKLLTGNDDFDIDIFNESLVLKIDQENVFETKTISLKVGQSINYHAYTEPFNKTYSFRVADTKVATVIENEIVGLNEGQTTITFYSINAKDNIVITVKVLGNTTIPENPGNINPPGEHSERKKYTPDTLTDEDLYQKYGVTNLRVNLDKLFSNADFSLVNFNHEEVVSTISSNYNSDTKKDLDIIANDISPSNTKEIIGALSKDRYNFDYFEILYTNYTLNDRNYYTLTDLNNGNLLNVNDYYYYPSLITINNNKFEVVIKLYKDEINNPLKVYKNYLAMVYAINALSHLSDTHLSYIKNVPYTNRQGINRPAIIAVTDKVQYSGYNYGGYFSYVGDILLYNSNELDFIAMALFHETGHKLDYTYKQNTIANEMNLLNMFNPQNLNKLRSINYWLASSETESEYLAEVVRKYIMNENTLKRQLPEIYDYIEKIMNPTGRRVYNQKIVINNRSVSNESDQDRLRYLES